MFNASEPLGLPEGSVRALIALAATAAVIYLFVTGQVVPDQLMTVTTLVIGYYFGARVDGGIQSNPQPAPLAPPYIPEDEPPS